MNEREVIRMKASKQVKRQVNEGIDLSIGIQRVIYILLIMK